MIIGKDLPNIPWQDKPAGCKEVIWRYSANPVIKRNQIPGSNSIFNSAIVEKDGKFVGVFRSDDTAMQQHLFLHIPPACREQPHRCSQHQACAKSSLDASLHLLHILASPPAWQSAQHQHLDNGCRAPTTTRPHRFHTDDPITPPPSSFPHQTGFLPFASFAEPLPAASVSSACQKRIDIVFPQTKSW